MPLKDLADKLTFSPRAAFWIALSCLVIVLLNNYVYLQMLEDRDKAMSEETIRLQTRETAILNRERVLRLWEIELLQREKDFSELIRAGGAPRSGEKAGKAIPRGTLPGPDHAG